MIYVVGTSLSLTCLVYKTPIGNSCLSLTVTKWSAVMTHESYENCESALTEVKSNSRFAEKRFHTRSMMDEKEIIALLDKIDVMVSENDPHCYSGAMCDENKEQKENKERK